MRQLLRACLLLLVPAAQAQDDDRFLPLWVNVTVDGIAADTFTVSIYKDNVEVGELPPSEHSTFKLALEVDGYFTIRVGKEGHRAKLLAVDTHVPEAVDDLEHVVYTVDLEPLGRTADADAFYLDFPSALIRWYDEVGDMVHSEHYLADLRSKVAPLRAQADGE